MGRNHRDGKQSRAGSTRALIALLAALWLTLAGPFGPDLPPLQIVFLGPSTIAWPDRPDSIDGLDPSPPDKAVAILFKGAFDFGGTDALTEALDAAPHVRLIAFDSPGGRPLIAEGVAKLIHERHLDTTVETNCASACTVAYVAGTVRTAQFGSRFGFHLATGPLLADLGAKVFLQIERRWFVRGGASLRFAERALHAPNPRPYFPPLDELLAAGYVHRIAGKSQPAPRTADALLAAVTAIEPQTGAALIQGQASRVHGRILAERAAMIAAQHASLVVDRWFGHSSDAADVAVIDATLAAFGWFAEHDAHSCMRWQIGRDDQDLSLAELPLALRAALLSAQARVLEDANAFPVPLPEDDGSLAAADAVVRHQIAAEFGPHALADASSPEHAFDDPSRSCAASTAYLRGLRERAEGARLLRWALGAA